MILSKINLSLLFLLDVLILSIIINRLICNRVTLSEC